MEFELLFFRPPVSQLPISFVAAVPDLADQSQVVDQVLALRGNRSTEDELILLVSSEPDYALPARIRGVRLRYLHVDDLESGAAMNHAVSACRHPSVFWFDSRSQLKNEDFAAYLKSLNAADLVVGERSMRFVRFRRPIEWFIRWTMGVLVPDPLFPSMLFRRNAVKGIEIQSSGDLRSFELIAKANYLEMLIDLVRVTSPMRRSHLLPLLWKNGHSFRDLFWSPQIWNLSRTNGGYRPDLTKLEVEGATETVATDSISAQASSFFANPHLRISTIGHVRSESFTNRNRFPRSSM